MDDWISVEDRLPDNDLLVLAYIFNPYTIDSWITTGVRYNGSSWSGNGHCNVTHWMPLPEPPMGSSLK